GAKPLADIEVVEEREHGVSCAGRAPGSAGGTGRRLAGPGGFTPPGRDALDQGLSTTRTLASTSAGARDPIADGDAAISFFASAAPGACRNGLALPVKVSCAQYDLSCAASLPVTLV